MVRGRDLFHATTVHRLLQALLGLPQPRYHHHRLILDADGHKLSKSTQATGLRELARAGRNAGRHPPAGRARLSAASVAVVGLGVREMAEAQAQKKAARKRARRAARRDQGARRQRAQSRPRSPASRTTSARR